MAKTFCSAGSGSGSECVGLRRSMRRIFWRWATSRKSGSSDSGHEISSAEKRDTLAALVPQK